MDKNLKKKNSLAFYCYYKKKAKKLDFKKLYKLYKLKTVHTRLKNVYIFKILKYFLQPIRDWCFSGKHLLTLFATT